MMLNNLYIFLLYLPAFLAEVFNTDANSTDPCPYKGDIFLNVVTLSNTEEYITKNDMATAACYKHIEGYYPEALDDFISKMTEASCEIGALYPNIENILENYPFLAALEIKNLGIEMNKYYSLIRKEIDLAHFDLVKKYIQNIRDDVRPKYNVYLSYLEKFKTQNLKGKEKVNEIIGKYCQEGTSKFMKAAQLFKLCMDGRISTTELYLNFPEDK